MARYSTSYFQTLQPRSRLSIGRFLVPNGRFLDRRTVSSDSRALSKFAQPSVWHSIVPRALRNRSEKGSESNGASNPATYFIWIYVLIGSQAIRILQLQNDFTTFIRRADIKIAKLREVVQALQRGDEIDVEKALGTGDETQEREWEEALREIENEDRVWQQNAKQRREAKAKAEEEVARKANEDTASPVNDSADQRAVDKDVPLGQDDRPRPPGFY